MMSYLDVVGDQVNENISGCLYGMELWGLSCGKK